MITEQEIAERLNGTFRTICDGRYVDKTVPVDFTPYVGAAEITDADQYSRVDQPIRAQFTPEEDAELIRMRKAKCSMYRIGAKLDRSYKSISARISILKRKGLIDAH